MDNKRNARYRSLISFYFDDGNKNLSTAIAVLEYLNLKS